MKATVQLARKATPHAWRLFFLIVLMVVRMSMVDVHLKHPHFLRGLGERTLTNITGFNALLNQSILECVVGQITIGFQLHFFHDTGAIGADRLDTE